MPRRKQPPKIEDQVRALIAQALEEKRYNLAKKLTVILEDMDETGPEKEAEKP